MSNEAMTTDEAREYLVEYMEKHFTDKTYHRYIRGQRGSVNLAGDFAWQLATALRRTAHVEQGEPFAYCTSDGRMLIFADFFRNNADSSPEGMTKLYTHPAPVAPFDEETNTRWEDAPVAPVPGAQTLSIADVQRNAAEDAVCARLSALGLTSTPAITPAPQPVASIGDDAEFRRLLTKLVESDRSTMGHQGMERATRALKTLVAYIDARTAAPAVPEGYAHMSDFDALRNAGRDSRSVIIHKGQHHNMVPIYLAAPQPSAVPVVELDAKRWRALIGSARIRTLGSAGLESDITPDGKPYNGYAHMGLEIWTKYGLPGEASFADQNKLGIDWLAKYADMAMAVQGIAAPQPPAAVAECACGLPVTQCDPRDRFKCKQIQLAAIVRAELAPEPVMVNGTKLSDYLEATVPEDQISDEWTKGYEECKRRLFKIVGHQLRAMPAPDAGVRDAALEEAAAMCESQVNLDVTGTAITRGCAAAIRMLKFQSPAQHAALSDADIFELAEQHGNGGVSTGSFLFPRMRLLQFARAIIARISGKGAM